MKLFRKLLISLLPEWFQWWWNGISPVWMFVGLVAPKQFFSLIHRKIIENYKLNQFDINLDSFEASLWFGPMAKMSKKEIDNYFAYQATASMNGWMFYCPSTIATIATILAARSTYPVLQKYDKKYALAFFESIVVLCYAFASKIKVVDTSNPDEALRRTVDLIFDSMGSMDEELDDELLEKIQWELLHHVHIFIYLMYTFERLNTLFSPSWMNSKECVTYLLWEHHLKSLSQKTMHALSTEMETRSRLPVIDEIDDELLGNVLPSDSLIISLLGDEDWALISEELFKCFIDQEVLDTLLTQLSTDPSVWETLMKKMMDYTVFKQHAHKAIKELARKKFGPTKSYEKSKEIDSFMSTIEQKWSLDGVKIPESMRQESMLMDKIMNFYIGFVGGLFVWRWDSYEMRFLHSNWIKEQYTILTRDTPSHDVLYYYWGLLYHYSKNLYYYQYAFDNIKAWNEMFNLPLHGKHTQWIYTNTHLIDLINQAAIPTLFQDFNEKILIITLSNNDVLDSFKALIWPSLQSLLSRPRDIVDAVYRPVFELCTHGEELRNSTLAYWKKDTKNLKENLYTLDFWLWWELCDHLSQNGALQEVYDDASIVSTLAMLRDTWTWRLIRIHAVQKDDTKGDLQPWVLWTIYVVDILNLSGQFVWLFETIGGQLLESYSVLIETYTKLDDTPLYTAWWIKNRKRFLAQNKWKKMETILTWDDGVWFRSYLKSIQYYTKRYLKPKS